MDSLTQIVLGAAVGELVAGRKIGYRAALWGAFAGTLPDLDVLTALFLNPVDYLAVHRGFSHSVFFPFVAAPVLAYIANWFHKHPDATYQLWLKLFFWAIITHPFLDLFTGYGTQLFNPISNFGFELNTIFIIDPLYTIPFAACLIGALRLPLKNPKRKSRILWGFGLSTGYLMLTVVFKLIAISEFREQLKANDISYQEMMTIPGPLNSFLWRALVKTDEGFYQGYYSIFDPSDKEIRFYFTPKTDHKLEDIKDEKAVQRLLWFSKGYYEVIENEDGFNFFDLRFGSFRGWDDDWESYVFNFALYKDEQGAYTFHQEATIGEIQEGDFRRLFRRTFGRPI